MSEDDVQYFDEKAYKREWSRRRRAELRAEGLSAHGLPYAVPETDTRRQIKVEPTEGPL